jgi:RNA polymerase sigma-70 factor (ECF subfamily)
LPPARAGAIIRLSSPRTDPAREADLVAAARIDPTPVSLLQRLRQPAPVQAWGRFVDLYTPLLYDWACRLGLQESDAADLVQDVLVTLVQKLPEFSYDRSQSFRGWLRVVLLNTWRNQRRRPREAPLEFDPAAGADGHPDPALVIEEADYRSYLVGRALRLMKAEFEPSTWRACWEYVVRARPAAEVAAELGLTVNAVYLAKSRVLSRLRQELAGLLN